MQERGNTAGEGAEVVPRSIRKELSGIFVTYSPANEEQVERADKSLATLQRTLSPRAFSQTESLASFIQTPTLTDSFGTEHDKRREWQNRLEIEDRTLVDTNAIKRNYVGAALSAIEAIALFDPRASVILRDFENERLALLKTLEEQYDEMDDTAKLEFVDLVKTFSLQVLEALQK